jgi:hypothetical protein
LDALPPSLAADPPAAYGFAPGDIYPRGQLERELCASASHPDWVYLMGLLALDGGAIWFGSSDTVKLAPPGDRLVLLLSGPAAIGLTWGATVGGAWLALPKCSATWVGETPREGQVRAAWPLAIALALLAGATAPFLDAIAIGSYPTEWTTLEQQVHVVTAAVAGFGGALLPYLIPPRTWTAARELDRIRFGADARGSAFVGYSVVF